MPSRSEQRIVYLFLEIESHDEVETGVAAVDDFVATILNERAEGLIAAETFSDQFSFECGTFFDGHLVVVFGEASLSLFIDHE